MDNFDIATYFLAVITVMGGIFSAIVWIYKKGGPFVTKYLKQILKQLDNNSADTQQKYEDNLKEIRALHKINNDLVTDNSKVLSEIQDMNAYIKEHSERLSDHEIRIGSLERKRLIKKYEEEQ